MFLSDNGMSMPFAKSNCYLTSTKTPWIARWPGKILPPMLDTQHFVSGIDFMPTILDAASLPHPPGMDGRSFLPLLVGQSQPDRDHVFTCYNDNFGGRHYPMRCLQTQKFGYIYNPWSNGKTEYRVEPMTGLTFPAMERAAVGDSAIASRVELLIHRVPEEYYDFATDTNALHNLIADPRYQQQIARTRRQMLDWMRHTKDPLEGMFLTLLRCSLI
jgi:N-sulfoglucosamine sulfohydrolase